MAATILTNVRLFVGGIDLTGQSNKVELSAEYEEKERTTYGSGGWKEVVGGIGSWEAPAAGFWEAGGADKVDDATWSLLGGTGPWAAVPVGGAAVGDMAYLSKALHASYKLLAEVGEVAPWEGAAKGSWPMVRGVVAHPPGTARSSSGDGTAQQLGAVAAGQRLYGTLNVLSVAGTTPSLTVAVKSDADSSFASPTTQLTFDAATSAGGRVLRTDGTAITDTWYRPSWTISGTGGPSFLFLLALGIK